MSSKRNSHALPDEEQLLRVFASQNHPLRLDPLLKILSLKRRMAGDLLDELEKLAGSGKLVRLPAGAWMEAARLKSVTGTFRSLASGDGIVLPDNPRALSKKEHLYIPARHTKGAWSGDRVRALLLPHGENSVVVEILERALKHVPAVTLKRAGKKLFCRPAKADVRVHFTVELKPGQDKSVRPGDIVELSPEKELAAGLWQAVLIRIVGKADSVETQERIVKLEHNVPGDFPALALRQAESFPSTLSPEDMAGREDLRSLPFVTIDGADARDFDDAIHVEKHGDGWLLQVAIADVSHYVHPDKRAGSLDAEALERGNSWYFPRSVEPMLPEALSNGLCSLRPDEDRLAMLVEIPFDRQGDPGQARFACIVMRSAGRLTYDQAENYFKSIHGDQGGNENFGEPVNSMLASAFELYKTLAAKRVARGSLDFDLPEAAYEFDANGGLAAIGVAGRHDSNRLIEEFMVAANEAVARELGKTGIPFLYRVHPAPEASRLRALHEILRACAMEIPPKSAAKKDEPDPNSILEILDRVKSTPLEYAVNRLCLRAMQQARYQPENIGHFGLASSSYCHFTSPIRRYADLLAHRALKLSMGRSHDAACGREELSATGEKLNARERQAMECEREMARRLGCLLLRNRIGEEFKGTISSVASFGVFVELAGMPIEGMIRLADLGDDWFELDERQQRLVGTRSGMALKLGQELNLRLLEVDMEKMGLRLAPAKKILPARKKAVQGGEPQGQKKRGQGARSSGSGRPAKLVRSGKRPSGKAGGALYRKKSGANKGRSR